MGLHDTLTDLETPANLDKADWRDGNNWSPVRTIDGKNGLRISLERMSEEERNACKRGLEALNIPFHERRATAISHDEKNIATGDLCIRILDPQGLDKLSAVFKQTIEEKAAKEQKRTESSAAFWNNNWWEKSNVSTPEEDNSWIDSFWAKYDERSKSKDLEYLSPWDAFVSKLTIDDTMSDEQAMTMFSKAHARAKDSSFVDPNGKSLKTDEWTDTNGSNLLFLMIRHGRNNIAKRLVNEFYSDVKHANKGGFTPLHAAAETGSMEMCKLLLQNGANPLAKTKDFGSMPYEMAKEKGHKEVADYLLREAKEKHLFQVGLRGYVNR